MGWRKRLVVHIYHGILTKVYGRLKPPENRKRFKDNPFWSPISFLRYLLKNNQRNVHVRSVNSDVHFLFNMAAERRNAAEYKQWGFPRYDRINRIIRGKASPVLTEDTEKIFNSNEKTKILYAPTQWDGKDFRPFALKDFDIQDFKQFLQTHNFQLLNNLHPVTEKRWGFQYFKDVIDADTIVKVGYKILPVQTEILPLTDILITDYSSTYINFLPFDRPILFCVMNMKDFVKFGELHLMTNNIFLALK